MDKNFSVAQANEIVHEGCVYDLHNHYDFCELRIFDDCRVRLAFVRNVDYGADNLSRLLLTFEGVDYLEISPGFGTRPIHDVLELGYKAPGDRDDAWLMSEEQAGREDHFFIRLDTSVIRIHALRARADGGSLLAVPIGEST